MKKPRKPKRIDLSLTNRSKGTVYADFDETEDCCVYVGGRHYTETAQIHLSRGDVKALAAYLTKADAYLSARAGEE